DSLQRVAVCAVAGGVRRGERDRVPAAPDPRGRTLAEGSDSDGVRAMVRHTSLLPHPSLSGTPPARPDRLAIVPVRLGQVLAHKGVPRYSAPCRQSEFGTFGHPILAPLPRGVNARV